MALFSKQSCDHCGDTANLLTRTKLKDGKYICSNCSKKCPGFVSDNFLQLMTYADFVDYLAHREENRKKWESFDITDVYFEHIYVDMNKGWMAFDHNGYKTLKKEELINKNPDIFEMKDLVYYNFLYFIKDAKIGVINDKVKADVSLAIAFNNRWYPYAYNSKVLYNHKHKAKINLLTLKTKFTENEKKQDLEMYLLSSLVDNGVNIPVALGNKLTMNFDLSPYDTYLKKVFELKKLGVYQSEEFDGILDQITLSPILKLKIKNTYGK